MCLVGISWSTGYPFKNSPVVYGFPVCNSLIQDLGTRFGIDIMNWDVYRLHLMNFHVVFEGV